MKILMVNKFLYPGGGAETYVLKLGAYLSGMGHEVEYFGMSDKRNIAGNRWSMYTDDIDFHKRGITKLIYLFKIIYSFKARRQIRAILGAFQPDVVHLSNFNFQITPSIIDGIVKYRNNSKRNIKIVYTAHDYQLICPNHMLWIPRSKKLCFDCEGRRFVSCVKNRCIHNSRLRSMIGCIEGYLYKWKKTYRYIDKVIAPSRFIKEKLETNPDLRGRVELLKNYADTGIRSADAQVIAVPPVATPSHAPDKGSYVLYFGRYSEEKGIATLVEACLRLPDIPFVFAGSGLLEGELRNVPNIVNVGQKSGNELADTICNARFSVFPSECYENSPFSVIESISLGTPVIGADIGGVPELICAGKNGELFESGNADELAHKISLLWEDTERCAYYENQCLRTSLISISDYYRELLEIYGS